LRTLIVYATKHGTVARCARLIAERLPGGADLADLRVTSAPGLDRHGAILIGGSIYAGRIQSRVRRFCERNRESLLAHKVGLFICCLYAGPQAQAQLSDAFAPWLSGHAFASRPLGGAVRHSSLGPFERLLFRRITGTEDDLERIDYAALEELAEATTRALG